jgi:hypothetical protein
MGRPGLVGTMARTAVVAGTATAVAGGVTRRQARRANEAEQEAYEQQAVYEQQAQMAEMQARVEAMEAQQAPAAAPAPAPAAGGGGDVMAQLQQLADMKQAGLLDDAEFAAAKAKLLA